MANYSATFAKVSKLGDHSTCDLLTRISVEEEAHIDWLERQKDSIAQVGILL